MRIQIKGSLITPGTIKEALEDALKKLGFSEDKHILKGVNLYFNVHDRDTGENIAFSNAGGEEIEGFIWMTPDEREKHRARVDKKRAAEELSRERERVRLETQARIQAAREKDRAKREAKKAAAKVAKEGAS